MLMKQAVAASRIPAILKNHEKELLGDWMKEQLAAPSMRGDLVKESDLREQSRAFLSAMQTATQRGSLEDVSGDEWARVKDQPERAVALASARGVLAGGDRHVRVLAQAAAVHAPAQRAQERSRGARRGDCGAPRVLLDKLGLLHHRGLPEEPRGA